MKKIFLIFLYFLLFHSNVLAFTFKQSSADLSGVTEGIRGINFNPDGTIMYVWDSPGDNMLQYALSTPYDLSTMSLTYETDISEVDLGHHIEFNSDGTQMFIIDNKDDRVEQFTLATAWNTSNVTHNGSYNIPTETQPRGLAFKPDGTKLFTIGDDDEKIRSWTLATAWDIDSGKSGANSSDRTNNYENKPKNLQFNSDGTVLYIAGENGDDINKLTLSTAYDTSSSSLNVSQTATTYDVSAQSDNMRGFVFIDNSSVTSLGHAAKFFITDDIASGANTIKHYFINVDPTLSSCSPADGATGVGLNDNIVLTFSEIVDAESGNVVIKKSSDDSVFETIDVTGSKVTGSGTSTITINLSNNFSVNTDYYITVESTAFDDVDSASYAGISDSTTCNFTTGQTNPLLIDDKDLIGTIEAYTEQSKRIVKNNIYPIMHRLEWLRRHRKEKNLTNQNIKFNFSNEMFSSLVKVIPVTTKEKITPEKLFGDWFIWSEGLVSIGDTGATIGSSKKETNASNITIGADKKVSENKMYGYALQFGRDSVDVGSSAALLDTDNYSLAFYGTIPHENNMFLDGVLGVSALKTKHIRKKNSINLKGERNGKQFFSSIKYNKIFKPNDVEINPSARIDLGFTELSTFSEKNSNDALIYEKHQIPNGMAALGILFNKQQKLDNGNLIKGNGRIEYIGDFSPSTNANVSYVIDPSIDYFIPIGNETTHNYIAGLGFDFSTIKGWSLIINYERHNANGSGHSDNLYFSAGWVPNNNMEYALTFNGKDNLSTDFNIVKNIGGFDFSFNVEADIIKPNPDRKANLLINKKF